jgi:MGT family glycosyltransferase
MPGALFVNIPARGHINPTLPVVSDLVERGEPVIYCLPAEDEPLIRPTGAKFRAVANNLPEARERKGGSISLSELPAATVRGAIRTLPQLLGIVEAEHPSYVVYDAYCLAGRLLAQLAGLPAVATYATYAFNQQALFSGAFSRLSDPSSVQLGLPGFEEAMQELVAKFDVPAIDLLDLLLHSEPLNIAFIPREFQPAGETFDDRWVFVGPSLAPRPENATLPMEHLGGGPVAYVSLGTVYNDQPEFFRAALQAFEGTEWRVVVATGEWVEAEALGTVPGNVILQPWVPQLEMLARADVFVTHGGMNSTMEALASGVPLVVVPQQSEQRVTADRVAELGLGRRLDPGEVSPEALLAAVTGVARDPGVPERLAAMREAVLAGGGHDRAATEILRFTGGLAAGTGRCTSV